MVRVAASLAQGGRGEGDMTATLQGFGAPRRSPGAHSYIFSAASRGYATAQVGVVGLVRVTIGVLMSARGVTKRMSD